MRQTMANKGQKTILITGGAGFIGSHLSEKYLGLGHRVICVDNLRTTKTTKNIDHLFSNPRFRFVQHDIIRPYLPKERVDWIFNFGCSGAPAIYQYDPVHTLRTNVDGMRNMLMLAHRDGAVVLQASTSEVYGDPLENPQKEGYRGNVSPTGPRACYDEGKRAAETLCMDFHRQYGTKVKIIRIFNTYGPRMDLHDGRAIANFVGNALDGKDLVIYGDGSASRSFQYIDDLVDGIDRMMNSEDEFVGPVNIGNDKTEMNMKDLAAKIIEATGSTSRVKFENQATDDPKERRPDISLAKEKLGWEPKVGFDEGLKKTIQFWKTIERPDHKVLVFATTYYPDMGPAERALDELSDMLPRTQFHIVTCRFRRGLPSYERHKTDHIYRIGFGSPFDKYLLPILGALKAWELHRQHKYHFAWSIMASYGGLSAIFLKFFARDLNFLLTLDPAELDEENVRTKKYLPIYRWIFRNSDSVYVADDTQEGLALAVDPGLRVAVRERGATDFLEQMHATYSELINKRKQKLARPR